MRKYPSFAAVTLTLSLFLSACAPAAQVPTQPAAQPTAPSAAAPTAPTRPTVVAPSAPSSAPTPAARPPAAPAAPAVPAPQLPPATVKRGGTLRALHFAGPANFIPYEYCPNTCSQAIGPVVSSLLREHPDKPGQFIGDLAETWESNKDGTVFTFHIRRGVKWHDGTPLTAEQVAWGIQKQVDGNNYGAELRGEVSTVQAVDANTVVVRTKQPSPILIPMLGNGRIGIAKKDLVEKGADLNKTIIGTGPFKNLTVRTDVGYTVERNPDYFLPGLPYLERIQTIVVPDRATGKAALFTGQVDMAVPQYLQEEWAQEIVDNPDVTLHSFDGANVWVLGSQPANPPFNDKRVVRAAVMAIDRNLANQVMLRGRGSVFGVIPPMAGGYSLQEMKQIAGYRDPQVDKAEAKKLLAEAGYAKGLSVELIHRPGGQYRTMAVFVADQLAQVGITVKITTTTDAEFLKASDTLTFKNLLLHRHVPATGDPCSILTYSFLSTSPKNGQGHKDRRLDEMIGKVCATADPSARAQVIAETQRYIYQNGYNYYIFWGPYIGATRKWVKNYMSGGPLTSIYNNRQYAGVWLDR